MRRRRQLGIFAVVGIWCGLLLGGSVIPLAASAEGAAGPGRATPTCFGRAATIVGNAGHNTLRGTAKSDVIVGLGGNDTIYGGGGRDFICGGAGDDTIYGGTGNDVLSGDDGNDLLVGGAGNDRIFGRAGADTLRGQDGDDVLTGGAGADRANGGPGVDTCGGAETRALCEVIPPTGCTNPTPVPPTPVESNPRALAGNAYAGVSSISIDGEKRRLSFGAVVRNDAAYSIRPRNGLIRIYDGGGRHIATRYGYPVATILGPGETTVVTETMPSMLYMAGESNFFPEGWASWSLGSFNPVAASPESHDLVIIGSSVSSVVADGSGKVTARGVAVNTLDRAVRSVYWWIILYDASGRLINIATASDWIGEGLAPGAQVPFEVSVWTPSCFATVAWGAAGGMSP